MFDKKIYTKALADSVLVSVEDLTPIELKLIDKGYDIFIGNLDDIKTKEEEIKRLSIALVNLKAMTDYEPPIIVKDSICKICGDNY